MKGPREAKRVSDEAVKGKTGKVWAEWFKILDTAGAKKWPHKEIARYLYDKQKVPGWWSQMVTVEYERARGLREKYQKCEGDFAASGSRTFSAPLAKLYQAWADGTQRRRWLPGAKMDISTATANQSIRAAWDGNKSRLSVNFYRRGKEKTQVTVDHMKLASAKESAKMKSYWFDALNRLQRILEGSARVQAGGASSVPRIH